MGASSSILIVAGETSADQHGAALVRELKLMAPDLQFFGIGGDHLLAEGVQLIEHADRMAVMGFAEVVRHYPFIRSVFLKTLQECDRLKPARAILLDYPGFNLRLAKELVNRNIPVTYYISPQLWAWKEKRIEIIRRCVDQMLCIFPFEEAWYRERGVEVTFVGHPFMEEGHERMTGVQFREKHMLSGNKHLLALMPGSRQQEIDRHLPVMLESVALLKRRVDSETVIGKALGVTLPDGLPDDLRVEMDQPTLALEYADVGIVSSGTVSLQAALFETPSVVIYRMHPITWLIAKSVAHAPFASMTNLVAGEEVLPELLQGEAEAEKIAEQLRNWLESEEVRARTVEQLASVKRKMGGPGASSRAAQLILEQLS